MKQTIALLALALLTGVQALSQALPSIQELPNVTAHSPDVASLGRYGDHPVDMSTGVPNINIPLYTVQSGQLQLPISLSYHSGGIKVDQEASFVGLGWNLNTGGVITRVIQDKSDDEATNGFIHRGNLLPDYNPIDGEFPAGTVGNDPDPSINGDIRKHFYFYDKEPDIYNIQTATGLSAQFSLDNNLEYVSLEYAPLDYDVDFANETIVVTDQNGTVYRFGRDLDNNEAHETSNVTSTSIDVENGGSPTNWSPAYDSSWHLTEIISGKSRDTISFRYKSYNYSETKGSGQTRYKITNLALNETDAQGNKFNSWIRSSMTTSISNARVIDSILFKNGYIKFSTATDRLDTHSNVPRITGFTVHDNDNNQIRRVELVNDDHFDRTAGGRRVSNGLTVSSSDRSRKSLKLNGVRSYGSDDVLVQEHTFGYDPTAMPPRYTTAQDHWGYYNGATGNTDLVPSSFYLKTNDGIVFTNIGGDRGPDFDYMKAGVLNKITFPTGGHTEFVYEPHYYLEEHQEEGQTLAKRRLDLVACNRLSSCPSDFMDGIPSNNTLDFTVTEDVIDNGPTHDGELTVFFSDFVQNSGHMSFRMTDLDTGAVIHYFEHVFTENDDYKVVTAGFNLVEGHSYRLEAMTNGVTGSNMSMCDSPWIEVNLTYDYYTPATPVQLLPIEAGGLRIKTITNHDSDGGLLTKKEYTYGEVAYGPNNIGTGTLISDPSRNFYYKPSLYYYFIEGPNTFDEAILEEVLWFTSSSQVEIGTNSGSPVDYTMVTEHVTSISNGSLTAGKTEHYYSPTGRQVDKSYATKNRPHDSFIFPRWQRSTLEKKVDYRQKADLSYEPVHSEEHTYSDFPEERIKTLKIFEREPELYQKQDIFEHRNSQNRFYYYNFYVSTGKRNLTGTTVKDYENGVETMSTATSYTYGNQEHLQMTSSTSTTSDGRTVRTQTWYPDDVDSNADLGYDLLDTSEYARINDLKGTLHRIAEPVQVETSLREGTTVISKSVQRTNYANGWGNNIILPKELLSLKVDPNTTIGPMEERIIYEGYNADGRPVQVKRADGPSISYIWGYNGQYPVAKVENATYAQAVATLTSAELTAIGEGAYSEATMRSKLDKVRTGLPGAMVTTYTFDPLVGVTSVTYPSGQTIYYTYDNFNRLKEVRDRDNNLVSDNQYHYKGQ